MNMTIETGGFYSVIFMVLLVLKLSGTITWSWYIVFLPILLPLGILIITLFVLFVLWGVMR